VTVTATVEPNNAPRVDAQTTVTVGGGSQVEEEEERPGGSKRGSGAPTGEGQPTGGQPTAARCVVPKLAGKTLAATRKALAKAHCKLGKVTRKRSKGKVGVVVAQKPKAASRLPAGSHVSVVLRRH
jgi:PASTA domain